MVAPKDVGRSVGLRHPGNFWLQKALFLQDRVIGPVNGSPGSRKRGEVRDGTGSSILSLNKDSPIWFLRINIGLLKGP